MSTVGEPQIGRACEAVWVLTCYLDPAVPINQWCGRQEGADDSASGYQMGCSLLGSIVLSSHPRHYGEKPAGNTYSLADVFAYQYTRIHNITLTGVSTPSRWYRATELSKLRAGNRAFATDRQATATVVAHAARPRSCLLDTDPGLKLNQIRRT